MRKSIPKSTRIELHNEMNGRCGYCGDPIEIKSMQVDHKTPIYHYELFELKDDPNDKSNLICACRRCNKWKDTFTITEFRKQISLQVDRLKNYNANYRLAKSFGLIEELDIRVKFYFETI